MSFWLRVNEELEEEYKRNYKDYIRESGSHAFNLTLGLEPMEGFTFKHVIVGMLSPIYTGPENYVTISYLPARADKVISIMACRPQLDEYFNVQVAYRDKTARYGNRIMCSKDLSLNDTIRLFYDVLVKYETPDTSDWEDITDIARYLDD